MRISKIPKFRHAAKSLLKHLKCSPDDNEWFNTQTKHSKCLCYISSFRVMFLPEYLKCSERNIPLNSEARDTILRTRKISTDTAINKQNSRNMQTSESKFLFRFMILKKKNKTQPCLTFPHVVSFWLNNYYSIVRNTDITRKHYLQNDYQIDYIKYRLKYTPLGLR